MYVFYAICQKYNSLYLRVIIQKSCSCCNLFCENCRIQTIYMYKLRSQNSETDFLLGCGYTLGHTRPNCKPTVLCTSFETSETCCFSQEATETGGGGLGATSRQCTSTHSTLHPGSFGKSWHSCHSATTLLP